MSSCSCYYVDLLHHHCEAYSGTQLLCSLKILTRMVWQALLVLCTVPRHDRMNKSRLSMRASLLRSMLVHHCQLLLSIIELLLISSMLNLKLSELTCDRLFGRLKQNNLFWHFAHLLLLFAKSKSCLHPALISVSLYSNNTAVDMHANSVWISQLPVDTVGL